ncbi:hypothetical protein L210DRAFT_3535134 [Boletus edulis BED1]|uniref:F-box domain-containing protein n=1 Tax=Boletus edulis BED1 TaxID=1328754 RepID=A0AAD4BYC4_BOLED|nr:hypothetical protein L210DRAFT_3535134 [Boletus edulis BED1]
MINLADLSLEIIDRILFALDPLDIARVSQTSRSFYETIYGTLHHQFWRGLYLAQPLDDPRRAVTCLGRHRDDNSIDWKGELERIMRARTVMQRPAICRREERCQVLHTCIDLLTNIPPLSSPDGAGNMSRNVRWMQQLIGDGAFLERESWEALSEEEEQLLARLHVLYGLTSRDLALERRRITQAFVYSLRHHTVERAYGPFLPGGTRRVDWVFISMFQHDLGMLLVDEDDDGESYFCPLGLLFSQSIIPRGLNLDVEEDWAGMEGLWSVRYGFIDHREFILYNYPSVPDNEPQDTSIFDDAEETLATLDIYIRVSGIEPDPSHPTRPQINIIGEVDGKFNIVGFVKLTDDDQVWCHYGAGNDNQMVWNCDAIGLGNVRSQRGFLGVWSTVFHDVEDPIGNVHSPCSASCATIS